MLRKERKWNQIKCSMETTKSKKRAENNRKKRTKKTKIKQ